jgi:oligopeptide transport system substrate-binding protein
LKHSFPTRRSSDLIETAALPPDELAPGEVYTSEGAQFISHLFQGLLFVDRELNVVPAMADNMRVSSDGLEYLFRLKEGVRWSDGEPVTADDFVYAWEQIREERAITAFLMEDIVSAEALDDRTLEVKLREPRSYFPFILASGWAYPRPRHKCLELGDAWHNPENLVGNGPFVLQEMRSDGALLTANPYWTGPRGNVRDIGIRFVAKGEEQVDAWLGGRYDVLQALDPRAAEAPDTVTETVPELSITYVGFRPDCEPFSNVLVRKAFSHAIDREAAKPGPVGLVTAATKGGAIPPAMPGHSHRVAPVYDLDLARRLLEEAGYPGGRGLPELTLVVSQWGAFAEALAEQWAEIGATVNIRRVKGHLWASDLQGEQMWLSGWTADYPDPDGFFRGLFEATGWPFYLDEEIEDMLERARSLQDQSERMRIYHELDRLWIAEHAAILPLFYGRTMLLSRPWVEGVWANPISKLQLDQVVVDRESVAAQRELDTADAPA